MEGLEQRKRLADLITFGCGFIETPGVHARKITTNGAFALVSLIDGGHAGKDGWVPAAWLKGGAAK
jgi:hypothetical protein